MFHPVTETMYFVAYATFNRSQTGVGIQYFR